MALFCVLFPWCTPETFWDLTYLEWQALRQVVDQRLADQRQQRRQVRR